MYNVHLRFLILNVRDNYLHRCHINNCLPKVQIESQFIDSQCMCYRVYTSLLGKKSSLTKLKQYLREKGVSNFSTTELCQGKTMRWAIGWTFDTNIKYPVS